MSPYRDALAAISKRTGSPLPSLIVSFAVLHEITAIVPLVGIFYAARGLHVGEHMVNRFTRDAGQPTGWLASQLSQWVDDGEQWAHRVGRRYGLFGIEKGINPDRGDTQHLSGKLAGDVANAVLAYATTKALLPARIGLSLYLSPAFSRGMVEPIRRGIIRFFHQSKKSTNIWWVNILHYRYDDLVLPPQS